MPLHQACKPDYLVNVDFLPLSCLSSSEKLACEQALLFGQAKCPSWLRRSLARSRETRFTHPNRRACSQASEKPNQYNEPPPPPPISQLLLVKQFFGMLIKLHAVFKELGMYR